MIQLLMNEYGIKVKSSATKIKEALESWKKTSDTNSFNLIKLTKISSGKPVDYSIKDLMIFLESGSVQMKLGLEGERFDIITSFWERIINDKNEASSKKQTEEILAIPNEGNPNYLQKGAQYIPIDLFTDTTLVKPNEADDDFFSRFRLADENILYKDLNGKVNILFKNDRGKLDLQNELNNDDDSLWSQIVKDLGIKWKRYIDLYKAYLKTQVCSAKPDFELPMTKGWIPDEDSPMHLPPEYDEDGNEIPPKPFLVPTIFRYLIRPVIQTKNTDNGKFENILCRGKSQSNTLTFDDMMDMLTTNWTNWTKGYIQKIDNWKSFSNRKDAWAVNVYDIPTDWKKAEMPPTWDEFFNGNGGKNKPRILQRVYFFIGSCLDANNVAQQALLIADEGETGKSKLLKILKKHFKNDLCGTLENEALTNPRFAVYSYGLYKYHMLFNQEYDGKSGNNEFFKKLVGGDSFNCEIKGGKSFKWNSEGCKVILTSNNVCITGNHAIRRRILPVSFTRNFTNNMTVEFEQKLEAECDDFLKYCYKVYKTCKYRETDGSYKVMNADQEAEYEKNHYVDKTTHKETYLMKGFSADEDLRGFFKCGDWTEETHMNDDYIDLYDELFTFDERDDSFIPVKDFLRAIEDLVLNTTNENYAKYYGCFDWTCIDTEVDDHNGKKSFKKRYKLTTMNATNNKRFVTFLEKTQGNKYNKVHPIKNDQNKWTSIRVVMNIKLKHDPNEDEDDAIWK